MNPETKLETVIEELRDSSTEVKLYTLWEADGYIQLKNDPEVDSEESLQSIKLMNQYYIDLGFPENIVNDNDEGAISFIKGSEKLNKRKKVYNSVAILECLVICDNNYLIGLIEDYIEHNNFIYESDIPIYVKLREIGGNYKTKPEETWGNFCKDNESTVSSIINDTIRFSLVDGEIDDDIKKIIDIKVLHDICWFKNQMNFNVNKFKFTLSKKTNQI